MTCREDRSPRPCFTMAGPQGWGHILCMWCLLHTAVSNATLVLGTGPPSFEDVRACCWPGTALPSLAGFLASTPCKAPLASGGPLLSPPKYSSPRPLLRGKRRSAYLRQERCDIEATSSIIAPHQWGKDSEISSPWWDGKHKVAAHLRGWALATLQMEESGPLAASPHCQ